MRWRRRSTPRARKARRKSARSSACKSDTLASMRQARWVRLEFGDPLEQWPAGAALSHLQTRGSAPIVLWSRFSVSQEADAPFGFAFIVPVHLAPGKTVRWAAWA